MAAMPFGRPALLLALCLATGALLRFAALETLPPAHYRDVALTATDARRALAGSPRLHYTYDEGLYANIMALGFLAFGPSDWSVRAPGALFGLLTCWGVFLLGQSLRMPRAGLWGAGLLAVSSWHVILSRSGFRAVLLPCLLAFSLALLAAGLRHGGAGRLLAGGALFGLGWHVYPAVRFAPLILPAWLLFVWRRHPDRRTALRRGTAIFLLAAAVVAAPMAIDYLRHPEHFTFPHRVVSVFSPRLAEGQWPSILADNVVKTILMFHVRGDDNARHHLPGAPLLDPIAGLLLLAGAVVLIRPPGGAGRGREGEEPGGAGAEAPALLFGWVVAMLLPNLLSVEGVPHGLRASGAIPALFLVAGAGLAVAEAWIAARAGAPRAAGLALAVVLAIGAWTGWRCFAVWGRDPAVVEAHDGALRAAARVLRDAPPGVARFVLANGDGFPAYGHPVETQVYLFDLRDAPPEVLGPRDGERLLLAGRPALIAFERRDERALAVLRALNPGAPVVEVRRAGISPDHPVYRIN
jgi:4-amino-4-deoxy-L-arabinose transferase-like glycosyltransferase